MRRAILRRALGPALAVSLMANGVQAQDTLQVRDSVQVRDSAQVRDSLQAQSVVRAHIRHVADAYPDTPAGLGLLPTAVSEAEIALQHARLARRDSLNVAGMRRHSGHVVHALDPAVAAGGPGMGYGVGRAAEDASAHVELAAGTPGASENVTVHARHVTTALANVTRWSDEAVALAQRIQSVPSVSEAATLVRRLLTLCEAIAYGTDRNGDGIVGWEEGEGGLAQARYHMSAMKRGEGLPP